MRVAVTGARGLVGRGFVEDARARGAEVVALSRPEFDLDGVPGSLAGVNVLIHCAFDHVAGRYRGGEGDDPNGFLRRNRDGSLRLFERAVKDGVGVVMFLSSRAVYGSPPPGTLLREDREAMPDTLYGRVKTEVEVGLAALPLRSVSLRSTGVYGPGAGHKWEALFRTYLAGESIAPRAGTEVHVADLAAAGWIALEAGVPMVNVSDIVVDRRDLLAEVARITACDQPLPERANAEALCIADCTRLNELGWAPGGWEQLRADLPGMVLPLSRDPATLGAGGAPDD